MKLCSSNDLVQAGIEKTVKEWEGLAITAGSIVFFVSLSCAMFFMSTVNAIAIGVVVGALGFASACRAPAFMKKLKAGRIEKELPLALHSMAAMLRVGIPFEKCLEYWCDGFGELSKEMKKVLNEAEKSSLPEALNSLATRIDSRHVKRVVMQLVMTYEQGGENTLRSLAKEISELQKSEAKKYSGKFAMLSLIFIAVSAIVPALFQAMVIVGSKFMALGVTELQALVVPVVVFPFLDIVVLAFIWYSKPGFMR